MIPFIYDALPARIMFGSGTVGQIPAELQRLGCSRAIVVSTPEQHETAAGIASLLDVASAGVFARAAMHTPADVTAAALDEVGRLRADAVISVGGGSAIGLGKAIALRTDLPQIAVPTTYAGSEATPILGETEDGRKTTQRTLRVLPETVVYDVDLTLTLPPGLTATSGLNAIAHAVEALYAQDANPIASMLAEQAIALMAPALRSLAGAPGDHAARSDALYASWACGTCLGLVGMSLHHKLCHVLGGSFGLPHAPTHAVILPHAVAYNETAAPDAMRRIADALGTPGAAAGLFGLARALGAPSSLAELGMNRDDVERAASIAAASPYPNPAPLTRKGLRTLLEAAFNGREPSGTNSFLEV